MSYKQIKNKYTENETEKVEIVIYKLISVNLLYTYLN
jgi:hypothetical protein